jgi:AraC-like DNA-binding protein
MSSAAADFAPIHFTTAALPAQERVPFWRDMLARELLSVELEPNSDLPFQAEVTLGALPGVRMVWCRAVTPVSCRRTPEIVAEGDDSFALLLNRNGAQMQVLSQRAEDVPVGRGEAIPVLFAEPAALALSQIDWLGVIVPRVALAPLVSNVEDAALRLIPNGNDTLRLLTHYLEMLREENFDLQTPELRNLIATHIQDLMAMAIGATRDGAAVAEERGLRAARLAAIKDDIFESIGRQSLNISSLAARHHVTPRSIQMLFESDGTTFSEFVLENRLLRAHHLLRDPRFGGRTISSIAYETGFGDLSYFNRTFRRRFGATPSDVRAGSADGRNGGNA